MKFFAGAEVTWGKPKPLTSAVTSARDIVITADGHVFPHLTVKILRGCAPAYRYVSPNHAVVDHVSESGRVEIQLDAIPGFTLGAVRAVLGAPTSGGLNRGAINDEFGGPSHFLPTTKGSLVYEDLYQEMHVDSAALRDDVTFAVKLNPERTAVEAEHLSDTDSIERRPTLE